MENLGKVCQIGYLVDDLDAAIDFWVNTMHVGPWFVSKEVIPDNYMYRGNPSKLNFSVALSNMGDMQIELMKDNSGAPNFYAECIREGNMGINHFSIWKDTEGFNEVCKTLLDGGYVELQSGSIRGGRFAYFGGDKFPGQVFEVSEMSEAKGQRFQQIAEISKNWDGKDPIR